MQPGDVGGSRLRALGLCARRCAPLLVALGGCARSETTVVSLGLPTLEDARSMLVVAVTPDRPARIEARALDSGSATAASFTSDEAEAVNVYVLTYAFPLEVLGIPAGTVSPGAERALPQAQAVFERASTASSVWTKLDSAPGALAAVALSDPLDAPCRRWLQFENHIFELPGELPSTRVNAALALGDGSAFIGTSQGRSFRASAGGARVLADPESEPMPYLAGAPSSSGDLWLLRSDALLKGHPDRGFQRVAEFGGRARNMAWMREARDGRVWILTDESELWRFDGAMGIRLSAPDDATHSGISATGGLIEVDEAMVVMRPTWLSCADLFLCPAFTTQPTPIEFWVGDAQVERAKDAGFRAMSLGQHPVFGAFVGTDTGQLHHLEAGEWKQVADLPLIQDIIWALVPDEEVLMVSSERGTLRAYHPALGFCPGPNFAPGHLKEIVPLGGSKFLLTIEADFLQNIGGNRLIVLER